MSDMERQSEFVTLQKLLASKRSELPSQDYFDGFVGEFHRRQRAEMLKPKSIASIWWEKLSDLFSFEPVKAYGYSFATAAAALMLTFSILTHNVSVGAPTLALQNGKIQDNLSHYLISSASDATASLELDQRLDEMSLASTQLSTSNQAKYVLNDTPTSADDVLAF